MMLMGRRPGYLGCVLLVLPLVVLWSLATPVEAVPDGSAALITAASVVRGEFGGPLVDAPGGREELTNVPGGIVALRDVSDCLVDVNALPNHCGAPPKLPQTDLPTTTQFNRYPPLPFLLVGWPTLFLHGTAAYWGATVVAAVMNSLLLGLALWLLLTFIPGRLAILGWLTALTPQVLYLGGSISASGFEISTATATWSGLLALAVTDEPPDRLVALTALPAAMFMLARPTSPAWLAIAVAVAAAVAGRERVVALAARRSVRIGAAVLVGAALVALTWLLSVGKPTLLPLAAPAHPVSTLTALRAVFFAEHGALVGQIGLWFVYYVPSAAWVTWFGLFALVCVGGMALAPRRVVWSAIVLAVLIVTVPIVVGWIEYNHYGFPWQGKDGVPFSVGLPLLGAAMLPERLVQSRAGRRLLWFALACFVICAIHTFLFVLHRYTNGANGSWTLTHFGWQPPGGFYLLLGAFVLAVARVAVSVWRWYPTPANRSALETP
jgi:hypothetical protein